MKALHQAVFASILAFSSAFATAAEHQDISPAQSGASVQMNSQQELTSLFMAAAKTGNQDVLHEFLKNGFPVDARNAQGYTALMMAAYYGQSESVSTLLGYGADRCLRDGKGNTALMGALFKMEFSIAKQLRKVDCDANAKAPGQKTAAEFAQVIGQEKQLQQIIEAVEKNLSEATK